MFQQMFRSDVIVDLVEMYVHRLFVFHKFTQIYTDSGNLDFCNLGICEICGSFSFGFQNVLNAADGDEDPAWTIV
jgi:hypothetical protein